MKKVKEIEKLKEISEKDWETVNCENKKMMKSFLSQSTNLSDQTLKQYESALRIFFWYVKENSETYQTTGI